MYGFGNRSKGCHLYGFVDFPQGSLSGIMVSCIVRGREEITVALVASWEHCASTPLQTEISICKGVNFGIHLVSACLGYLLPEPFTYALYFVVAIV